MVLMMHVSGMTNNGACIAAIHCSRKLTNMDDEAKACSTVWSWSDLRRRIIEQEAATARAFGRKIFAYSGCFPMHASCVLWLNWNHFRIKVMYNQSSRIIDVN
jgi:hypothetical protein